MKMRKANSSVFLFLTFLILGIFKGNCVSAKTLDSSGTVLDFKNFISIVKEHHPINTKSDLEVKIGEAYVTKARGNFDPKLYYDFQNKDFNQDRYYAITQSGIKIPTRLGLELQAGLDNANGKYLNPQYELPSGGLAYAGVSLPIGQGLFIDKRRAELQKAKLYREYNKAERDLMLNELLYEAGSVYWEWFTDFHILKTYQEALSLAEQRLEAIKKSAVLGDIASIDTTEVSLQVSNIKNLFVEANLDFNNSTALLETYLWADGYIPLNLDSNTIPKPIELVTNNFLQEYLLQQKDSFILLHPKLFQMRNKISQLEVERKYRADLLKPRIDLKYNALQEATGNMQFQPDLRNNYNFGLQFAMPIFLRKERGDLRITKYEIQQNSLDSHLVKASLNYFAIKNLNEWQTFSDQVTINSKINQDLYLLLEGENIRWNNGESSIFMVNLRETNYIRSQVKLIEILAKNQKAEITSKYALGILHNNTF